MPKSIFEQKDPQEARRGPKSVFGTNPPPVSKKAVQPPLNSVRWPIEPEGPAEEPQVAPKVATKVAPKMDYQTFKADFLARYTPEHIRSWETDSPKQWAEYVEQLEPHIWKSYERQANG